MKRGSMAGDEWFRMSVPATECPRIRAEFLEEERRAMGAAWFAQEYMCEFVDNGTAVFGRDAGGGGAGRRVRSRCCGQRCG